MSPAPRLLSSWTPVSEHPDHPLRALDGLELAGGRTRVVLGPTSRFGARYFAILLEAGTTAEAVLTGLHRSGPLPSYNWIEVAETRDAVAGPRGRPVEIDETFRARLFRYVFDALPPGGHVMVEYDSPQRADTAWGLAHKVPAIATPLGALLFRAGFGAHFKDWQIAEGGSEGPRKLQAYKPPDDATAARWRRDAVAQLEAFISAPEASDARTRAARERARILLDALHA